MPTETRMPDRAPPPSSLIPSGTCQVVNGARLSNYCTKTPLAPAHCIPDYPGDCLRLPVLGAARGASSSDVPHDLKLNSKPPRSATAQ